MLYKKNYIIPLLALICIIALLFYKAIPQDPNYHNFADKRRVLGIPNLLNVITNLPFTIIGLLGLRASRIVKEKELKHINYLLFIGFLLLTIGSSYYHLLPQNNTLFYDRVPMVIIFMSFLSFIIYSRINKRTGYKAFVVLNIIGIISVIYWILSEKAGKGDLRWYGMIQFFPVVAIPLILFLYSSSLDFWKEIFFIFLFFGLAKLSEKFDKEVYYLLRDTISGHSLKHLLMAIAGYIVVMIQRWVRITTVQSVS